MVYFTSDLHFGHANIIRYCSRPFNSITEMDKTLIKNWNATVQQEDEIYILGDFTMLRYGRAKSYLSALNGKKYLIKGNHDLFLRDFGETEGWFEWVKDYAVITDDGYTFVLFHYPIVEWYKFGKGSIHLYGHLHNSIPAVTQISSKVRAFNVGVDVCGYKPVSSKAIIERASKLNIIKRHNDDYDLVDRFVHVSI